MSPTMIKGLFNIPLDILILILFNSLILSFRHFMADIMGQTVHQAMSDSITDTAECMFKQQSMSRFGWKVRNVKRSFRIKALKDATM